MRANTRVKEFKWRGAQITADLYRGCVYLISAFDLDRRRSLSYLSLMQGLFEDAVVNGWLQRRASQPDGAGDGAELQSGNLTQEVMRLDEEAPADSSDDGRAWEPCDDAGRSDDDDDGAEDDDNEDDVPEDEEEDDSADFGDYLREENIEGEIWSSLNPTRRLKSPQAEAPHCLRGFERELDSKLWLHPEDDCVVQRFDGVSGCSCALREPCISRYLHCITW